MSYPAYVLPGVSESDLKLKVLKFENKYGKVELEVPKLERNILEKCFKNLSLSREYLKRKPLHEILGVLYRNTELWLEPNYEFRKKAEKMLPITSGFSPSMIHTILDGMMNSFKKDLYRMKTSKKENFPELVVCVPVDTPGPQALAIIKALTNKSAIFCKSPSSEPVFTALYTQSFTDVDEEIARCIATAPWEGGKPEHRDLENFVYGERTKKEGIVVFGNPKTIESIREKVNPDTKFTPYDRGVSFGIIGKEMLTKDKVDEVALAAALAVCMYDQRSCFSSQLYYVERGGEISPAKFSKILAQKMGELEIKIPRGDLPLDTSATITELMRTYELLDLVGNLKLHEIRRGENQTGAVIYKEDSKFESSCLYRVVRVKPVNDVSEVPKLVESISKYLNTVGVALPEEREDK
ncbi:MAG: acyl-CoA reductase, partial [Candidatus Aenigmarchaeota archaeon]|nr:acyl-CoA reductase [Candidatus Aenigmarchaeota archaeon]